MNKTIKILVVDDSKLVRQALIDGFSQDEELEVVGEANDPYEAVSILRNVVPDVITLDIEMPKMNGITFLKKLMQQHPIPVVIISTLSQRGTKIAIKALEYGAVEVLAKPKINTESELLKHSRILCGIIKSAASANVNKLLITKEVETTIESIQRPVVNAGQLNYSKKVIAIGASTGGTVALKNILKKLPADCPGIVVVQHMPELFTRQFAERLDGECTMHVKEAKDGDPVLDGQVLIAQGNHHMMLRKIGNNYIVEVLRGPLVNRHMPSVDVLFKSVAKYAGKHAVGVIMTGMGRDGAEGMLQMKNAGAHTIAQDESSCIVFGMPKEAIKLNAVDEVVHMDEISASIMEAV